jgi:hypothetical protein
MDKINCHIIYKNFGHCPGKRFAYRLTLPSIFHMNTKFCGYRRGYMFIQRRSASNHKMMTTLTMMMMMMMIMMANNKLKMTWNKFVAINIMILH